MRPSRRQTQPFTRSWSAARPSVTVLLIALHAGIFAAQLLVALWQQEQIFASDRLQQWLGLSGAGIAEGRYWQFFSFMLLHEAPLPFHLLGNMLVLYFAGREVEPIIGSRNMFTLYFLANLVGGVCHYFAMPAAALVGVSAGAAAVLAAYATILPELQITANVFFVLPLRVRAKYLGVVVAVIAVTLWTAATASNIGPVAMLAGCVIGWIYSKQLGFGNPLAIQRYIFEKRQRAARLERMSAEQFISAEIDPILDKVSQQGMHSLTRSERKILAKGREKIAARTAAK
jgi:membrane associated rhomboid family serine protease